MNNTMEQQGREEDEGSWTGEMKKMGGIAAPMVAVTVFQYLLQVVSVVMIGHLGSELALSSVAIATSLTNVTGFSLLSGLAGGLETLCGQAYGAKEYTKLSVYTYSAIISLLLICPPISLLWIFIDRILNLLGQDPIISLQARHYATWLIPALFGASILKPITRYLQTQSLTLPLLVSSFLVLCLHVPLCWVFVYKLKLGVSGGAVAFGFSTWLNVFFLGVYIRRCSACERTRASFSKDAFLGIRQFFSLGVPSALMVCLKWWSMELLLLLSGLLPNPKLETSALSICITISTLHFNIPYGLGAAASVRVSNELGAGKDRSARMAVRIAMSVATAEAAVVSIGMFLSRPILGHAFSNDTPIVKYVAALLPLVCLSVITDSLQAVLSGVTRGCGLQRIGAYINLGAFYCVGLPVGLLLGFLGHLRGKGLWIGIVAGSFVQTICLSLLVAFTNWRKQTANAKERVSVGRS